MFFSAEMNSAYGFHSGNGAVSRTLPLSENPFVYNQYKGITAFVFLFEIYA